LETSDNRASPGLNGFLGLIGRRLSGVAAFVG
jgi:hypothetical protein